MLLRCRKIHRNSGDDSVQVLPRPRPRLSRKIGVSETTVMQSFELISYLLGRFATLTKVFSFENEHVELYHVQESMEYLRAPVVRVEDIELLETSAKAIRFRQVGLSTMHTLTTASFTITVLMILFSTHLSNLTV